MRVTRVMVIAELLWSTNEFLPVPKPSRFFQFVHILSYLSSSWQSAKRACCSNTGIWADLHQRQALTDLLRLVRDHDNRFLTRNHLYRLYNAERRMSMGAIDNAGLRTTYSEYGIVTSPIDEQRLTVSLAYLCSHIDEDTYTVTIFFSAGPLLQPLVRDPRSATPLVPTHSGSPVRRHSFSIILSSEIPLRLRIKDSQSPHRTQY